MKDISVEWVEEVPPSKRGRPSLYDPIIEEVLKTGKVARIESTEGRMNALAQSLRVKYGDEPVLVNARTLEDGYFVFVSRKGKK